MRVVEPLKAIVVADGMMSAKEVNGSQRVWFLKQKSTSRHWSQGSKYVGAEVESQVKMGHVAETLVDYATAHGVDLIVIATHGRSGPADGFGGVLRTGSPGVLRTRINGPAPDVCRESDDCHVKEYGMSIMYYSSVARN